MVETKRAVSAGGVIFRRDPRLEVAIISWARGRDIWALPKGTVEKGEGYEETAVREVEEETGFIGRQIAKIDVIDYWFMLEGVRYHKYVHFYLLEYLSGEAKADDWEVEAVEWIDIDEAIARLTFKGEREVLKKAADMLRGER